MKRPRGPSTTHKTRPVPGRWRAPRARTRSAQVDKAGPHGYSTGSAYGGGGPTWADFRRTRRSPFPSDLVEAYKGVAFACVDRNANGVARQALRLYATTSGRQAQPKWWNGARGVGRVQKTYLQRAYAKAAGPGGEIDEITEHPLLEMMAEVNADFDRNLLIQIIVRYLEIVGAAYLWPEATRGVVPDLVWPLLAQYVQPVMDPSGSTVAEYRYNAQTYGPDEILRIRHPSPRNPYGAGYSPLQAAFAQVGLALLFTDTQENLLSQGARPSAIVSPKDPGMPFGPKERERYQAELESQLSGGNFGRIIAIDGAIDYSILSFPPSDLGGLQINEEAFRQCCNIFGVPLAYMSTETNLANLEAAHRYHAEMAIEPRCILIASALTSWTRDYGLEHDLTGWDRLFWAFDNPVRDDRELNAGVHRTYVEMGALTIDEVRAELGYDRVPWGAVPWLPSSLAQPAPAGKASGEKLEPDADEAKGFTTEDTEDTEEEKIE